MITQQNSEGRMRDEVRKVVLTGSYSSVLSNTSLVTGVWETIAFKFIRPFEPSPLQPRLAVPSGRAAYGAAWGRGRVTVVSTRRKIQCT